MSAWHAGPQSDKMPSRKLRSAKQSPEDDYNPSRRQTKTVMVPWDKWGKPTMHHHQPKTSIRGHCRLFNHKTTARKRYSASISYASSHHLFSSRTCASSSGVKSLTMLNVLRISSGVFPLIMEATFAHVKSRRLLMSM